MENVFFIICVETQTYSVNQWNKNKWYVIYLLHFAYRGMETSTDSPSPPQILCMTTRSRFAFPMFLVQFLPLSSSWSEGNATLLLIYNIPKCPPTTNLNWNTNCFCNFFSSQVGIFALKIKKKMFIPVFLMIYLGLLMERMGLYYKL